MLIFTLRILYGWRGGPVPAAALAVLFLLTPSAVADLDIEVTGVGSSLAHNIRNHIGELSERERQQSRLLKRRLDSAVRDATEAMGFYDSTYQHRIENGRLIIDVRVGRAVYWRLPRLEVGEEAAEVPAIRRVLDDHPFDPQTIISHQAYDQYKRRLLDQLQEHGFLDARYRESRLLVDPEQGRATAVLRVDSGSRYRLESIEFSGTALYERFLKRHSPIQPGDHYRRAKVTELQRNLQNSRYFRNVGIHTETDPPDAASVHVELLDAPRHEFGIGLGFGTDTGPRARLRWERPRVNRRGHRLTTEARVSEPMQSITAQYRIPLRRPLYQNLNFSTGWERKDIEDTETTLGRVGVTISDRVFDHWTINYGVNYEQESSRQGSEPRQRVGYLIPNTSLTRVQLPPGNDPLYGYRTSFGLSASDEALGADIRFVRLTAGHKRLLHLGGGHLLIARAEVGTILTDDITRIPASQRFFTGGDQTVRGFSFESIATRDAQGKLVGGKYLNVASLEYSTRIHEEWRLAAFADTGRAFNDNDEDWRTGAGVGLRWLSPVGQIRVDLAFPIDDEEESGFRLHIFMGPLL